MPEPVHSRAVVLYGPPASGKDAITTALSSRDDRYRLFPRIKHGPGRTAGYRMVTAGQLAELRATGDVLWENHRYGATYLVDRTCFAAMLDSGTVPVLHLGQAAAIDAIMSAFTTTRSLTVALTCPRDIAIARIKARDTGDSAARIAAYDDTSPLITADLTIDTSLIAPADAAARISSMLE